jgi:hypothetical protein
VFNVKGCRSASQAFTLTLYIGLKCKINSTIFLKGYRVVLLRHFVSRRKSVVPRKSGWLGDVAGSVMEYGSINTMMLMQPLRLWSAAHALLIPLS